MTVDTFVKKALSKWVSLLWTILVERHQYITNIITKIIISIIVPDPILCVMLWSRLRGSHPDNWPASCSAKVSKPLEEGRLLEKVWRISFCNNCTHFSSVQSLTLFATRLITAHQASLSITNSWSSLRLMSIESVMSSSHLILYRPLLLLLPIPPNIRVLSNESALRTRWPKYWSFSISISPSNKHPGLTSFRMD